MKQIEQKTFKETIAMNNLTEEEYNLVRLWKNKVVGGHGNQRSRCLEMIKKDLEEAGLYEGKIK